MIGTGWEGDGGDAASPKEAVFVEGDAAELRRIGMTAREAEAKARSLARCDRALDELGAGSERWSVWVPGRIELFGKHTDYAGGRSLLCAVERGFVVRAALRRDSAVRAVDVVSGERCSTSLDAGADVIPGWPHYVATVTRRLARNFPDANRGVDLAFDSDLPVAAGMSSSSELMIAVFIALAKSNDLRSSEAFRREIFSREELASYLGCIENGQSFRSFDGDAGVGTFGGSQDHVAIMSSEAGRIVQYAFSPLRREAAYDLPATHTFVIASSGMIAEKTAGARDAYNRAAAMVSHLLTEWNRTTGRDDATLADAARVDAASPMRLRVLARDSGTGEFDGASLVRRVDQFLLESFDLAPAAGAALSTGEVEKLGPLAVRSQQAAEEWLGNQIPETSALVREALALGATAASAFGAGFGGSVWALVTAADAAAFATSWRDRYSAEFPTTVNRAQFFVSPAGPGAHQW
jgi:galactokinase